MTTQIRLRHGNVETDDTVVKRMTSPALPVFDTIDANADESIGSLAERGYGANTKANRDKILSANSSLNGKVILPRG